MAIKLLAGVNTLGDGPAQDSSDISYFWRMPVVTEGIATKVQIYTDGGGEDLAVKLYEDSSYDLIEDLGAALALNTTWNEYSIGTPINLEGISYVWIATNGDTGVTQNRFAESGALYYKSESYGSWVAGDPFSLSGYTFRSRTLCAGVLGYTKPVNTSVNGGSSVKDGDTGINVVGTDFIDSEGDPEFYLCSTNNYATAPIKVAQAVTGTPTDTGFQVTISKGGLSAGTVYGFTVSALGQVSDPIVVTLSESSYTPLEYVSLAQYPLSNGNQIIVSVPSGVQDGDLLFAQISLTSGGVISAPSGWTLESDVSTGGGKNFYIYSKVASSESGSYTWTVPSNSYGHGTVSCFRGDFDPENIVESLSELSYFTNDNEIKYGSVTTTENNQDVFLFSFTWHSGSALSMSAIPSGFTEKYDIHPAPGYHQQQLSVQNVSSTGATGDLSGTLSASTTDKFGVALVIKKAPEDPQLSSINSGLGITESQAGVTFSGSSLGESGGSLWLCSTNDFDTAPIKVSQGGLTHNDTGGSFNVTRGSLSIGTVYAFWETDGSLVSGPLAVTLSLSSAIDYDQSEQYRKYQGLFFPEYWPQAGPYAEQMVSESSEPRFLKTQKGVINLDPALTLGGISEDPVVDLDANNFDTTLSGFEVVENGTDIIKSISEIGYVNDSSLLFNSGDYIKKSISLPYKDDMIFEFIFKPDTADDSYIVNFGTVGESRVYIRCDAADMSIEVTIIDSALNSQTFVTQNDVVDGDHFYHVMIFITGKDSDGGQKYYIYVNGELLKTDTYSLAGYLGKTDEDFSIGSDSVNDTKFNLTMLRFWHRYKWFAGDQVAIVADRYNKYMTGEQDYPAPIPVTCFMWGDETGSIPAVMVCDNDGVWNLAFHGTSSADIQPGSTELLNGISGVRLCDKYEDYGYCNFDDIKTFDSKIRTIQIPRKYERVIKRIIAQTKTLNSWAVLMIEWI